MPYDQVVRTTPALTVSLVGGLLTACAPGLPVPQLDGVEPGWGYNGEDTDILILGEDLYPQVRVTGSSDFEVDRQFQAWLVDDGGLLTELDGVRMRTYSSLDATVPEGLETGLYGLQVLGPTGEVSSLSRVFEVRDTRAAGIVAEVEGSTYEVGDQALIDLKVVDPEGDGVALALPVEVRVTDEDLAEGVVWAEDTLEGQQDLADGSGIRGSLRATGEGFVALTSLVPANLVVAISHDAPESGIAEEAVVLAFTPGETATVSLELPRDDFTTVAGQSFGVDITLLDEQGFPTEGELTTVTLREDCPGGSYLADVQVLDSKTVFVTPTAATYTGSSTCSSNRIVAITSGDSSASEDFLVQPADLEAFELTVSDRSVEAGEDFLLLVQAEDAYGNLVADHQGELELFESTGEIYGDFLGDWDCGEGSPFEEGRAVCTLELWTASGGTVITAEGPDEDGDTVTGRSEAVSVSPAPADDLLVQVDLSTGTVTAGESFIIQLQVLDYFSNAVTIDPTGADAPTFDDGSASLACAHSASLSEAVESFRCIAELAEADKTVDVGIPSLDLQRRSDVFEVVNSELETVTISLGSSEVEAGVAVQTTFVATDAYGNPYLEQSDATLELADASNSVSPSSVELDSDGTVTTGLTFTTAMEDDVLSAEHAAGGGGESAAFDVIASDLSQLVVEADATWIWLDETLGLSITAADAWGNPVGTYSGSVTISSSTGLTEDVELSDFSAGAGSVEISFDAAGLEESLEATDGTVSGSSDTFDVVDGDCSNGPTASLKVGGSADATLCRTSGVTASTTLSGSSSSAGSTSLAAWHFHDGLHDWERDVSGSRSTTWEEEGGFTAQLLVIDESACGDLDTATVWVADDDGEAAGEIEVSLDESSLVAGSSSFGSTGVSVSATDCSGDPVSSGTLFVRADLGTVGSGSTTVSSTGSGLSFTTDSSGEADLSWSVASEVHAGTATLHVGVKSGAAHGSSSIEVTGDAAAPTVLWVEPYGSTLSSFDEMTVIFSESMRSSSITASRVTLTDGSGVDVSIESGSLSDDTLTLTFADTVDPTGQELSLTISSAVHDVGGTGLDGQYDGTGSDFELVLGDVADEGVGVNGCSASLSSFRPDGDVGSGSEAESVDLSLSAGDVPAWWEVVVYDSDGDEIFVDRQAATSASGDTWTWSGQGQDGLVVDNGRYTLVAHGLDDGWNAGASCTSYVRVDNQVRPPEGE